MDTLEALMTTRAIRRFTDEPVTDDEILTCLRAAQQAPSGGNVQPQQYLVVTEPDQRAELARWYRAAFDRYERSLPEPASFRDEAQATSWRRTRDASRHLADHLDDAPVIVLFLHRAAPEIRVVIARRAPSASISTGEMPAVKSKLPIRLTSRQATGDVPLRILIASWSSAASFCSYTRDKSRVL